MHKRTRWLLGISIALIICFLLLGISGIWWLRTVLQASLPQLEGTREVPGLLGEVRIERDGAGVPTIHAQSRQDAARALGWLHGQDRFFQMDVSRRTGAGALSGLFGAPLVETDRWLRFHPGRRFVEQAYARLPDQHRALLDAYAEGVNAGLNALDVVPPEYLALRSQPEPWAPEDGFFMTLSMYFFLQDSRGRHDLIRGRIAELFPVELVDFIFQQGSPWDSPIDDTLRPILVFPVEAWAQAISQWEEAEMMGASQLSRTAFEPESSPGSNAWAATGQATLDGRAILANDMHLGLGVPHVLYRVHQRISEEPEGEVHSLDGGTIPGMPVILSGSNGQLAWGMTNSYIDLTDLVRLELHPEDPNQYWTADGWKAFELRRERIEVAGKAAVFEDVRETIWGPVKEGPTGELYAVVWVASLPEAWNLDFLDLENARTVEEAFEVAWQKGLPTQNLMVADSSGQIGWTLIGAIPNRQGINGFFPISAEEWGRGWQGRLSADAYPRVVTPEGGLIWTANQRMLGGETISILGDGGYDAGYRAGRIWDLLQDQPLTEETFLQIQMDTAVPMMERWRVLAVGILKAQSALNAKREKALEVLESWDGKASAESTAYPLLRDLRGELLSAAWDRLFAPLQDETVPHALNREVALDEILFTPYARSLDSLAPSDKGTWEAVFLATLDQLLETHDFEERWGQRNRLSMQHRFSSVFPFLGRWLDMPADEMAGDVFTVRAQGRNFGAAQRIAVSPGLEAEGHYHQPGGVSGHFLSPFYRSGHADWVKGTPRPLLPGEAKFELRLVPPGKRQAP